MRRSPSNRSGNVLARAKLCPCPSGSYSLRSADLAGRAVALSPDIPILFDDPLAEHHRRIGAWVAKRDDATEPCARDEARRRIERTFEAAVLEILSPIDLVELRTVVLRGADDRPPAIVLTCESLGQIDLGWIETSEAPTLWRAAAYQALETTLGRVLPIFGYQDLFEEISHYYWDGETEDEAALQTLIAYHGADPDDRDAYSLPSEMNGRRPDWMSQPKIGRRTRLPATLRHALNQLARTHAALGRLSKERDAWAFDLDTLYDYMPGIEEASSLPPLTLVPFDHFDRELDEVARHGMEMGFMDVAGICVLEDTSCIDDWFASLTLGVRFLEAAQALLRLDPALL